MNSLFPWLTCLFGWSAVCLAQAPLVVETDPLTPEEQRQRFHLPEGFEIQLVVSDPEIGQPMQLNFDARGRLWVTHSIEYPYPARGEGVEERDPRFAGVGEHPPRDRLTILSGIGSDGRPAQVTHFVDGLNIPIGQVPIVTEGIESALCYSIPFIDRFTDLDGDGRARVDGEERQRLYGPFGNVDTHGNVSSFLRWLDGWVYATHGFRNVSRASGTDGHGIELSSGNTFRFREDGTRIEQYTWGQVNPFGMMVDPWGNVYTADCHSMPLTCLIPGAYYQSFGKPDDGLGFGPDMIDHQHGSTGICGCAWYEAAPFPEEYRGCIFLCNPVNGVVHRDRIAWRGSSPWVETQPEFITCDDGWFRPVDVKLGPDGALYIADFYNCIIGHYEVPLDHPRRDRTRGRIWRVVYQGTESDGQPPAAGMNPPDLTLLSNEALVSHLGSDNIVTRTLATHLLLDRQVPVAGLLRQRWSAPEATDVERVHALWILAHQDELTGPDGSMLDLALADASALVRTQALHVLTQRAATESGSLERLREELAPHGLRSPALLLEDSSPHVQRAAVRMLGRCASAETLEPLLRFFDRIPAEDTHLLHESLISLREHVRRLDVDPPATDPGLWQEFGRLLPEYPTTLARLSLGTRGRSGAALSHQLLVQSLAGSDVRDDLIHHTVRYAEAAQLQDFIEYLARQSQGNLSENRRHLLTVRRGLEERGIEPASLLREWGTEVVLRLLEADVPERLDWTQRPLPGNPSQPAAFAHQVRPSADGDTESLFFSSLPVGEQVTGVLQSDPFEIPSSLSFYIAGHNGFPDVPLHGTSFVALRDARTGDVLVRTAPPRNDLAQRVIWDLSAHAGQPGYLEVVDGDTAGAYAWLAVGRFSVEELNPGFVSPVRQAVGLISSLRLTDLQSRLTELTASAETPLSLRRQAAEALLALYPDARLGVLASVAGEITTDPNLRESCFSAVIGDDEERLNDTLRTVMRSVPAERQQILSQQLAVDRAGGEALLQLVSEGVASARLLRQPALVERLRSLRIERFDDRLEELTRDLPEFSAELEGLLQARHAGFLARGLHFDPQRGRELFKKHCAACHQVGGEGNRIGPQLDGIGGRGAVRLLEDILDPNRNVDAAFRTSVLALEDGRIVTGLIRHEEGEVLVLANEKGEEVRIPLREIDEQRLSNLSLMPANLGEVIPEEELYEMLAWLIDQPRHEESE